ncbi:MAG: MaoC family dehydratase [Dehalococcoidales bacterium]|nr:MaoC family dehydratase [Dehalococcoidales bacterium]
MAGEISLLDKFGIDIGYKTTVSKTVTETDIAMFAGVSSDFNPVHMNEEYAKKTFFGTRIAHGVISMGLLSAAGTQLPGVTILLSMSAKFLKPTHIGDTITAVGEIAAVRKDKNIVTMKTKCTNQKGEVTLEGETVLKLFEEPELTKYYPKKQ